MQAYTPVRKLAATRKCSATASGPCASWPNPVPWFPGYLTKAGLTGPGDRNMPPSLLKQIHARAHSCFPNSCLDSQWWWPGHSLEGFGLKVVRNLHASCYVSSMTDCDWLCGKKGLWVRRTNNRPVEMSWPAKIRGPEQDSGNEASGLFTAHHLPSFSSLNK